MNHVPKVLDGRGVRVCFRVGVPVFFEAGFLSPLRCGEVSVVESFRASQRGLLVEGGAGLVMAWRVCGGSFSYLEVSEESTRKVWLVAFAGWVWAHWASVVGVAIPGGMFMISIVWGVCGFHK